MIIAHVVKAVDLSLVDCYRFDGNADESFGNNFNGTKMSDPTQEEGILARQ